MGWLFNHLTSPNVKAMIPNYYFGGYECDIFLVTKAGLTVEYELKKTLADYKKDFEKKKERYNWQVKESFVLNTKHELIETGKRTNRFYYVIPESLEGKVEIPKYAGLVIYSEHHYFRTVKKAPMLHDRKVSPELLEKMLTKLFWRLYQEIYHGLKGSEKD